MFQFPQTPTGAQPFDPAVELPASRLPDPCKTSYHSYWTGSQ